MTKGDGPFVNFFIELIQNRFPSVIMSRNFRFLLSPRNEQINCQLAIASNSHLTTAVRFRL